MTTVEKTAAIRSLAQSLVTAGNLKYASIAAYWQVQTPQGKLSLYDVAQAAGFSKADVIAASETRQTKDGREYHRIPVQVIPAAGKAAGKVPARQAAASAFVQSAGSVRLIKAR